MAAVFMGGPLLFMVFSATQKSGLRAATAAPETPSVAGFMQNLGELASFSQNGNAIPSVSDMFVNSVLIAVAVAGLATLLGFLTAYVLTFLIPDRARFWFGLTLITLFFPVEARMLQTFDVAVSLGLVNSLAGLALPILPLALSTLIFRQHMKTFPPTLLEAARLDGAGPVRFMVDFVLPLSLIPIGAVMVVSFIIGWNQYLWPLIISVDNSYFPLMRGLNLVGSGSGPSMVLATLSILPPLILVLAFLRLFTRVTSVHV